MKTKIIFSAIIVAVLSMGIANAQFTPATQRTSLTVSDKAILDLRISKYTAFTIDNKELADRLSGNGGAGQFRLHIDENLDWTINLELNDLRAPNYLATYTSDKGTFDVKEPFVVNTYKGKTSDGQVVRFTIDENTFFGVILGDTYHYVIRSANDYTQNREDKSFIVYKSWDILPNNNDTDYIIDALEVPDDGKTGLINTGMVSNPNQTTASVSCPANYLNIATDADYEFYQARGSGYVMTILNIADGVYSSAFGINLIVTFQNVYTTSAQPYSSTNATTLRDEFRNYWNSNRTNIIRNIAHLFTGKNLDSGVLGISWIGYVNGNASDNYAYSITKNDANMQYTTVHEIGHNLGAHHPSDSNCKCGDPLNPPPPDRSVMCQGANISNLWFCPESSSEIKLFLSNNLVGICGPDLICSPSNTYSLPAGVTGNWSAGGNTQLTTSNVSNVNSITVTSLYNTGGTGTVTAVVNGIPNTKKIQECVRSIVGPSTICATGTYSLNTGESPIWGVSPGGNNFSLSNTWSSPSTTITALAANASGTVTAYYNAHTVILPITSCAVLPPVIHGPDYVSSCAGSTTFTLNSGQAVSWNLYPPDAFTILSSNATSVSLKVNNSSSDGVTGVVQAILTGGTAIVKTFTTQACKSGAAMVVSPNPVSSEASVEITNDMGNQSVISKTNTEPAYSIVIVNMLGATVYRGTITGKKINLTTSSLPNGIYNIIVSDGITVLQEKMLVKH